jgi:hypothetical protein
VTLEERFVRRRIYPKIEGHGWRRDLARVARLRQRDHERRGEADSARWYNAGFYRHDRSPFEDLAAAQMRVGREQVEWGLARSGTLSADRLRAVELERVAAVLAFDHTAPELAAISRQNTSSELPGDGFARKRLARTTSMIMSHLFNCCDEEDGQAELRDGSVIGN